MKILTRKVEKIEESKQIATTDVEIYVGDSEKIFDRLFFHSSDEKDIYKSDESYISTFASTVKRNNPKVIPLLSIWTQNGNMTHVGTLFNEWRVAIDSELKQSKKDQKKLILTMVGYYVPELDSLSYPVDSVRRNFDWVSLRSYDYHTRFTDKFTYNFTAAHTALYDPSSRVNTDYGINEWVKRGLPADKMVLGLAYHGYAWTLLDPNDNGIGAPAKTGSIIGDGSLNYEYIRKYLSGYKIDPVYNSTYVINYFTFGSLWVGFDDVEAIRAKVAYAKEKGLLGYNAWQVPNDHNWDLSKAAAQEKDKHGYDRKLLAVTMPTIASVILLLGCIICYRRRRVIIAKVKKLMSKGKSSDHNQQVISFADISEVTNCFSKENKLGEGGYGPVYKAYVLLKEGSALEFIDPSLDDTSSSFKLIRCMHVGLLCVEEKWIHRPSMLEVSAMLRNEHANVPIPKRPAFSTNKDEDEKKGAMMEEVCSVNIQTISQLLPHIKSSNIFLDEHFEAHLADFVLARLIPSYDTHVTTDLVGTLGYIPPEYGQASVASYKGDVSGSFFWSF
ncbi:Chitinase II [Artemisia annua]|uniref:Chitinase II n=1 Tax=Artemisia annua TaxID=35608 RepID=A0A2U1KFB1_ARTAN|nr:Chitinase II [Artemisia annua]